MINPLVHPLLWRKAKVRFLFQWGRRPARPYYIRLTPNFGVGLPWFGGRRLRFAWHHGLQITVWSGNRWIVSRQLLGKSKVKGEKYVTVRNSGR